MGSCLSKSGKKAKEEEDDDRMPYSPSDASKKGKYDVAETTAAHIPVQSNPRTDPPDTSPPPPPVGLPETSPTRVSQESNTAGAYASYPIKDISPQPTTRAVVKKSSDNKKPELISDVPATASKPANVVNLSPSKDQVSPTRSSLAAAKMAQRDTKSIPVATPTVPQSFITPEDKKVMETPVKVSNKQATPPTADNKTSSPGVFTDLSIPDPNLLVEKAGTQVKSTTTYVEKEVKNLSQVVKAETKTVTKTTIDYGNSVIEKVETTIDNAGESFNEVTNNIISPKSQKEISPLERPKNIPSQHSPNLTITSPSYSPHSTSFTSPVKEVPQPQHDISLPEEVKTKQTFSTFMKPMTDGLEEHKKETSYVIATATTKVEKKIEELQQDATDYISEKTQVLNGLNNNAPQAVTEENVHLEINNSPVIEKEVTTVIKEVKSSLPTLSPKSPGSQERKSPGSGRFGFGGSPKASSGTKARGSTSSAASSGEETSSSFTSPVTSPLIQDVNAMTQKQSNMFQKKELLIEHHRVNGNTEEDINENKLNHSADVDSAIKTNSSVSVQSVLYDGRRINKRLMALHSLQKDTKKSLLQNLQIWFKGESKESRICLVHGDGGMGKSCLATEVCNVYRNEVAACHFIDYKCEKPKHNIPRYLIQSIALMLCDTIPGYIQELSKGSQLRHLIAKGNVKQLFKVLITAPLSGIASGDKMIVIDALDQCDPTERETFLELLNTFQNETPGWLHLLLFTRNVNPVLEALNNATTIQIKHNSENASDMKKILKEPLGTILDRISLDGGLNQLVKKSGGSLLYCVLLKKIILSEMSGQTIALRNVEKLFPSGVKGIFESRCGKFKERVEAMSATSDYSSILGPIALSVGPLSKFYLSQIFEDAVLEVQEAIEGLFPLVSHDENQYDLSHKVVWDLLLDEQSNELMVDSKVAYEQLSSLCYGVFEGNGSNKDLDSFKRYAVKHMIRHLVSVPKQQEKICKVLCNLSFIQTKLCIADISIGDLEEDYTHGHWKILPANEKFVNLDAYMKKYPKLADQISSYKSFVSQNRGKLDSSPGDVLQIAANCSNIPSVQQEARTHLSKKPWLENITSLPDTPSLTYDVNGTVCDADLSSDGRTLAIITKDADNSLTLNLYNAQTGENKVDGIDLKSLSDRVGVMVKFVPDTQNIFAGSLSTFVNTKGKAVNTGFDLGSIKIKEKFAIECCDASQKHLVCAQNTFPFGGRSVHLSVLDMKTRKCVKTLEVLKFRFGGSSQFGVKACCLGKDKPLVAACIKQSPKQVISVNVWSLTKWQLVSSVELANDTISKCILSGDTLMFSGSMRSVPKADSSEMPLTRSFRWSYKGKDNAPVIQDMHQVHGIIASSKGAITQCSWNSEANRAEVSVYQGTTVDDQNAQKFNIRGVPICFDLLCDNKSVIIVAQSSFRIYNIDDLEQSSVTSVDDNKDLSDTVALELLFLPKSDTLAIVESAGEGVVSVKFWDARKEDVSDLKSTPFLEENLYNTSRENKSELFGQTTSILMCSPDGNFLVLNNGCSIKVWNRVSDTVKFLPLYENDQEGNATIWSTVSTKDSIIAVTTAQSLQTVDLFDLKTCSKLKQIDTNLDVSSFFILPSQANLLTYHKLSDKLQVFSVRSGAAISSEVNKLSYCRVSPALDRIALSVVATKDKGSVTLRSSDKKNNYVLKTPGHWNPNPAHSDLEFSTDGTILIGTCAFWEDVRIWNAGNGEVLNNISFSGRATIPGLMTNTHMVLQDERVCVTDVASGEFLARLPLSEDIERKPSARSLCFCSRSNVMAMCDAKGTLTILIGHNFAEAKRQTTLQRMKSFRK